MAPPIDHRRVDEHDGLPDTGLTTVGRPAATPFLVPTREARQGNTAILIERLGPAPGYTPAEPGDTDAPYGRFDGRHVIGSGSRIDGGVYLGRKPREAIVVDSSPADGEIQRVYWDFLNRVHVAVEAVTPHARPERFVAAVQRHLALNLPAAIADVVAREMPYDNERVRVISEVRRLQPDQAVELDVYIRAKGGVCRHQVCLVGVLLERLLRDGWIRGRVAVERKHVPGLFSHAWVRYVDGQGVVYAFDASQGLFARLEALDGDARVFYGRPDD